ncbi:hypothetical protein D3C87_1585720 [compost metagenome]
MADPGPLAEHALTVGLGGVGGDDQPEAKVIEGLLQGRGRDAPGVQPLEGVEQRARLGRGVGNELALAAPAHPVVLLGGVDQAEVDGEGAHDAGRLAHAQAGDQVADGVFDLDGRILPEALGEGAQALFEGVEALAALLPEGLAQELAQPADVVAQGGVLVRAVQGHRRGEGGAGLDDATLHGWPSRSVTNCSRDPAARQERVSWRT